MSIKRFTRLVGAAAVVAVVVVGLIGCGGGGGGGGGGTSALIGNWVHVDGETYKKPEAMELFKDGTGVVDEKNTVSWKVEGKRLALLSPFGAITCDYQVSGMELILTYDDETSATFVKKAEVEAWKAKKEEKATVTEKGLVGRWYLESEIMELFENGTGNIDGEENFTWKIDDKRFIRRLEDEDEAETLGYELKGSDLTLIDENGDTLHWSKKKEIGEKRTIKSPPKGIMAEAPRILAAFESAYLASLVEVGHVTSSNIIFELSTIGENKYFNYAFVADANGKLIGCKATALSNIGDFNKGNFLQATFVNERAGFKHCAGGADATKAAKAAKELVSIFFSDNDDGICR